MINTKQRLILFFLTLLMGAVLTSCKPTKIEEGTTAGMIVGRENGSTEGGTVFVANGENGKLICTIEHIGARANEFGVVEISSDFKLTGQFEPIGFTGGSERAMCAPVKTNWSAFDLQLNNPANLTTASVHRTQGQKTEVTVHEFHTVTSNETKASGIALVTSGVGQIGPRDSGSPLIQNGKVVGVLSGGSNTDIFFVPLVGP